MDEFGKVGGSLYTTGFVGAVNAQRPSNNNKKDHQDYNKVLRKLDALLKDGRLSFMMRPWDGAGDHIVDVLSQFLGAGEPVRIVDLSGVPNTTAPDRLKRGCELSR